MPRRATLSTELRQTSGPPGRTPRRRQHDPHSTSTGRQQLSSNPQSATIRHKKTKMERGNAGLRITAKTQRCAHRGAPKNGLTRTKPGGGGMQHSRVGQYVPRKKNNFQKKKILCVAGASWPFVLGMLACLDLGDVELRPGPTVRCPILVLKVRFCGSLPVEHALLPVCSGRELPPQLLQQQVCWYQPPPAHPQVCLLEPLRPPQAW